MAIVLSVLLRYTDSDCPFGIFKLFLIKTTGITSGTGTAFPSGAPELTPGF